MTGTPSAMRQLAELAEQMNAVAARYAPVGATEVIDEYTMWGEVLRTIAQAWQTMHDLATDPVHGYPLPPAVMDLIAEIHRQQLRVAQVADEVAPLARRLSRARLEQLGDRRNRMWDHRANPDRAA